MTTKFELGFFEIKKDFVRGVRKEAYNIKPDRELLFEVSDEAGRHEVRGGAVNINFIVDSYGHKLVELQVGECTWLKKLIRKDKRVSLSNKNTGNVFLPRRRVLFVSTNATSDQFKAR